MKDDAKAALKAEAEAASGKSKDKDAAKVAKDAKSAAAALNDPKPGTGGDAKPDLKADPKAEAAAAAQPVDDVTPPTPPPKPKRPASPFSRSFAELTEAFPDAPAATARAVLVAAQGRLEHAFNGLLALNDDTIRPAPPTPAAEQQREQLEHDERLARELAGRYQRRGGRPGAAAAPRGGDGYSARYGDAPPGELPDDYTFDHFRDDVQRGWGETTKKVGSIFSQLRDRIQNELNADKELDRDDDIYEGRRESGARRSDGLYGGRRPPRDDRPFEDPRSRSDGGAPPPQPPRPGRPVNAFGDEQPARWEPLRTEGAAAPASDAFFIGESDEEVEDDKPAADKDAKDAKDAKATEGVKPDATDAKSDAKADAKANDKSTDKDAAKDAKDAKD